MDVAAMGVVGRQSDRPFLGSKNPKNGKSRAIFWINDRSMGVYFVASGLYEGHLLRLPSH
jgi:hypothetical protein